MTEDGAPKVSDESVAAASAARQRKKRKWDQPAESLVAAGLAVPGALPFLGGIPGIALPGVALLSGPVLTSPVPATFATASQLASIPQNAAVIVQKLNQPKIQDELIAREIVINDAEPTIRYKLTKRQTQEEIQKSTGAVVITRGKYHPPNAPSDTEKPLYLHISAGSHCKDTAERIKAVDRAASMVEEILKQGHNPLSAPTSLNSALGNGGVAPPLSACLFLGFDPDPSLNIATRIRGPNDQYINHIMNETGATVVLRGRGSGNVENSQAEEAQQPLHLCLTSTTPKSLEDARILAENLLDTICAECGTSRISSCKVYNAVPPPQQLLAGVVASAVPGSACTATTSVPATPLFAPNAVPVSSGPNIHPPGSTQPGGLFGYGRPQPNMVGYSLPTVSGGTSYSGYGGIYPQATPLQQVALALRQAPASSTTSTTSTLQTSTLPKTGPSVETEKRTPQKRKFQELPVTSKGLTTLHQNSQQESEFLKPGSEDSGARNVSSMPPPKKFIPPCSNGMPPPPPRSMPPLSPKFSLPSSPLEAESRKSVTENMPPPPPKFSSPRSPPKFENGHVVMPPPPLKFLTSQLRSKSQNGSSIEKPSSGPVSDTLLKLVEYGEEDEDIDGVDGESLGDNSTWNATSKPFWAV